MISCYPQDKFIHYFKKIYSVFCFLLLCNKLLQIRDLKLHPFFSSQFFRLKVWELWSWILRSEYYKAGSGSWVQFSSGGSGENFLPSSFSFFEELIFLSLQSCLQNYFLPYCQPGATLSFLHFMLTKVKNTFALIFFSTANWRKLCF